MNVYGMLEMANGRVVVLDGVMPLGINPMDIIGFGEKELGEEANVYAEGVGTLTTLEAIREFFASV